MSIDVRALIETTVADMGTASDPKAQLSESLDTIACLYQADAINCHEYLEATSRVYVAYIELAF